VYRLIFCIVLIGLLTLSTASAAPLPKQPQQTKITVENADRVRELSAVTQDVFRIVWGPKSGEVSFLAWETPADVFDASTFKPTRKLCADKKLIHMDVSSNRDLLAWCENSTQVEVQNLKSGKSMVIETNCQQPAMAFSPDGKLLATGGSGTEAKLWDVATGKLMASLDAGGEGGITTVFSPDGKMLAVGNRNHSTRLYDVATKKLLHTLDRQMTQELKFSPDSRTLAVGYVDGVVGLWDVAAGKLLRSNDSGAKEVYTLDWSPKGDLLVTAGREGKITLWEPKELKALKVLDAPEWVIQVRFSPDGMRFLSGGGGMMRGPDRKVTVWGLKDN
jgi:WD40 repeat protein